MLKLSNIAQAALAVCAFGAGGAALADQVVINDFAHGTGYRDTYMSHITPPVGGKTVYAGEFTGTLNGNSFQTFCVDVNESFSWGAILQPFSVVSGAATWGAAKSQDVDKLFTNWYASANNPVGSTAFQLALWEIVYETGSYDLANGSFTAIGNTADSSGANALATTMLGNLGSLGSTYQHVDVLYSREYQDFTVVSTVPEPEGYALAFASLAVLVGARRLKARREKGASKA